MYNFSHLPQFLLKFSGGKKSVLVALHNAMHDKYIMLSQKETWKIFVAKYNRTICENFAELKSISHFDLLIHQ